MQWKGFTGTIGTSRAGAGVARDFALETDGTARMIITTGGNIGINNLTPTERLDVNGNAKVSGSFSTNTLGVSGASVFNSSAAFTVRPTVSGTGVLLSGELATGAFLTTGAGDGRYASISNSYLTTSAGDQRYILTGSSATGAFLTTGAADLRYVEFIDQPVYQTGVQTISGIKTFVDDIKLGISGDIVLARDGAGILAQRSGTNPQESRIYGTYTSATNFERLALKYNTPNLAFQIAAESGSAGGSARALQFLTSGTSRMTVAANGAVSVSGHFSAATKSFLIPHPTKPSKQLQYACLEGPENGVYIRGKTNESIILLPDYWGKLVDEDSVTVTATPIGKFQQLFVASQTSESVEIGNVDGFYNYVIYGERKDVDKLITEI
jgi:hypothetical protein